MRRGFALFCFAATLFSASPSARLYFLDIRGGRLVSVNPDGSGLTVLTEGLRSTPDGVVVDVASKRIYWTNMGKAAADDGSIQRVDLAGGNLATVVPIGGTFTPKQLKLDKKHGKLYWADREGMRIMRSNIDGSKIETLVETGSGEEDRKDPRNWCVGIAVDTKHGKIYWTQKGGNNAGTGSIRRADIAIPRGNTPANRTDIDVLFDGLPEPIDLDLDVKKKMMYWTDRGDPPRGNTVSRAPMEPQIGADPKTRRDQEILVTDLHEGIGIALDLKGGRMFFTDLGGNVYSANLNGSDKKVLLTGQGSLTGIAYGDLTK
jgi:DNA-binding beta-propeller fold protein YncE